MKKSFIKILVSVVFVFSICSSLFAENARVTYVKGKAEVLKSDTWVQLNVGDTVNNSDVISTGFQSEVKIEYGGSIMALGALTRITLENLSSSEKKDNVSVYLNTGAVRSKVTHTQEKRVAYKVKTPVAVASVRGTDFTVRADGTIACHEGAVVAFPSSERLNLTSISIENTEDSAEEDVEIVDNDEDLGDNPGDYGPANALTPANDISDDVPAGAYVVAAGQSVYVNTVGTTDTPMQHAEKEIDEIKNAVAATLASQESVSVGGASDVQSFFGITSVPTGFVGVSIDVIE